MVKIKDVRFSHVALLVGGNDLFQRHVFIAEAHGAALGLYAQGVFGADVEADYKSKFSD